MGTTKHDVPFRVRETGWSNGEQRDVEIPIGGNSYSHLDLNPTTIGIAPVTQDVTFSLLIKPHIGDGEKEYALKGRDGLTATADEWWWDVLEIAWPSSIIVRITAGGTAPDEVNVFCSGLHRQ